MVSEARTMEPPTREPSTKPPPRPRARAAGPGLFQLLRDLVDQARTLFRQELRLAKTELSEQASKAVRASISAVVGGFVLYAGFLVLLAAASVGLWMGLVAAGLSRATAIWLAPLIIGAAVVITGAALVQAGISSFKRVRFLPDETAKSLKETGRWIQEKVK